MSDKNVKYNTVWHWHGRCSTILLKHYYNVHTCKQLLIHIELDTQDAFLSRYRWELYQKATKRRLIWEYNVYGKQRSMSSLFYYEKFPKMTHIAYISLCSLDQRMIRIKPEKICFRQINSVICYFIDACFDWQTNDSIR